MAKCQERSLPSLRNSALLALLENGVNIQRCLMDGTVPATLLDDIYTPNDLCGRYICTSVQAEVKSYYDYTPSKNE